LRAAHAAVRYHWLNVGVPGWRVPRLGNDRTAYIVGLFGSGRWYVNELLLQNMGKRANFFRDAIHFHPGPTSMIYSGHATLRHVSHLSHAPELTKLLLEAVQSGIADWIFVYRHPLDSLLTNWIWWRTYLREKRSISGIAEVFKSTDDLCAELEQAFPEFKAFADGDPNCFGTAPGPRFVSFAEFVEETELQRQAASLTLRLEDFVIDPVQEFCRIVEVISADVDLSRLSVPRPRAKPYRYLAVEDKVPQFRNFIDGLNAETKGRIERIGYSVGRGAASISTRAGPPRRA
jgi:hypothetical protein